MVYTMPERKPSEALPGANIPRLCGNRHDIELDNTGNCTLDVTVVRTLGFEVEQWKSGLLYEQ